MKCLCCVRPRTHHCKIVLLDEQELLQEIQDTTQGQEILDTVFRHLNLLETSYFGLRYIDASNQTHWLDSNKRIVKQLKGKDSLTLYFGVKFYAVDPCKLLEEITRYQFFLQVKQDILQGRLPVTFELSAELGAYVVQSELGDYESRRHSPGYVSEFRFTSHQSAALETRVADLHRELSGQTPSAAELNYLDRVKSLPLYGVDLHPVLGEDSIEYFLGLTPAGIVVLRNKVKVASYLWPKITKIYSKGKYFMIRVCDKTDEENTYGFETPSRPACKHLYRCCVDHHTFFRLVQVAPPDPPPDIISSRFSSGRGDKFNGRGSQMTRNPPSFTRTPSKRYTRRSEGGAGDGSTNQEEVGGARGVSSVPSTEGSAVYGEMKSVSVPQPVGSMGGYHPGRSDSPRSTRSAPWHPAPSRAAGLFSHSPRSVRSAATVAGVHAARHRKHHRSSSVESRSSNDSKPCRRRRRSSRGKRGSDNESEHSRCSSRHHRRRNRHRSRGGESERGRDDRSERGRDDRSERGRDDRSERGRDDRSERSRDDRSERGRDDRSERGRDERSERGGSHRDRDDRSERGRDRGGAHRDGGSERSRGSHDRERRMKASSEKQLYELVDSESQWQQVQARRASIQQAAIVRPKSGYLNSGLETESEYSYQQQQHRRKHRKHSSRSRSPSEASGKVSSRLAPELARALEFSLVDTEGMSPAQLRSIPYTEVKTSTRVKLASPGGGHHHHRHHSRHSGRSKSTDKDSASEAGGQSLPPNPLMGGGESPPPPYSESSTSSLNKSGEGGPPEPQAGPGALQRPSSRSSSRHTSALYSQPASLLGNPSSSSSNSTPPWMDQQFGYSMPRRPSEHSITSSSASARSSLRIPQSSSAQQFPTQHGSRSGAHSNPNFPPRWQNSEIRGVGLSQYSAMGNTARSLYPTPPTSGSQSDLLDSLSSSPAQRHPIYNRSESISSDNLLESSSRMRDSSQRSSSLSSDNLLNSTYVDEESRQCNELIDFASDRVITSDALYRVIPEGHRKSNRNSQDLDRLNGHVDGQYRSQNQHIPTSDTRNNNQICDNDNLALQNRLQNIHLNQNLVDPNLCGEKIENGRIVNVDSSNRLGSVDNSNRTIESNNRLAASNAQLSSSVKVESGVLKRYTNTPSGGVIPWPGVGYPGSTSAGYQTGPSNVNNGQSAGPNMYGAGPNNLNLMRNYQQSSQSSSESDSQRPPIPGAAKTSLAAPGQYNPSHRPLVDSRNSPDLGFQGEASGGGPLRQEMMNTLSDASTSWDGLPISQYTTVLNVANNNNNPANNNVPNSVANNNNFPNSVANNNNNFPNSVANINSSGWADDASHLSNTNISGIAPLSRSTLRGSINQGGPLYYSPQCANQEIVITPSQLASMLTPISSHPTTTCRPYLPTEHGKPMTSSTPKTSTPSMASSTPLSTPTTPTVNSGCRSGPGTTSGLITPSVSRLVTSTPKGSPAESACVSFPLCNQSSVIPEDLEIVLEECESDDNVVQVNEGPKSVNQNGCGPESSGSDSESSNRSGASQHGRPASINRENSSPKTNCGPKESNGSKCSSIDGNCKMSGSQTELKTKSIQERARTARNSSSSKLLSENLPGIHRNNVGKLTRSGNSATRPEVIRNLGNHSESTDFQSTHCNHSSTANETMESGVSHEECSTSTAKLPNNINERLHAKNESENSPGRQNSISARTVDNRVVLETNIDSYLSHNGEAESTDLNRNDLSNIAHFKELGCENSTNRMSNTESTVDQSMYLDNRNATSEWSQFDYSGSISNNNLEETNDVSQSRGLASRSGDGGNNLMSKNHLYQEMCTEL